MLRKLYRWIKGSFWYAIIMGVAVAYYQFVPLSDVEWWVGFGVLALILWPVISALRSWLRF